MATAATTRFSIREYAAQARTWPFGGDAGALPPMEVRRFRWWAEEAAAVEEEEREVERRMAAKRRKRSVAELFAAVPRVAGGKGKKAVNGRMHAKEKGKLVLAVEVKASKGAKTKKKVPAGIALSKKEKSGSAKVTLISISQLSPDSTRKRKPKESLSNKKRNQEVLVLEKKCKKGSKNSVLDSKKNAVTNSVQAQSILEKQSKVVFDTLLNNKGATCRPNSSCKPKHVTFSHGNDMFGRTVLLPEDNAEQPKSVQTSQRPFQEGHDKRSREELQLVYRRADATPGAFEEDTSSLSETVVSTGVSCIFPGSKPKGSTIMGNSVDLNHCTEISNSSNHLTSISLACLSSKMASQNFDGVDSCLEDAEDFREENHVIPQGSFNPVSLAVKAISNDIYMGQLSQFSRSCLNDRSRSTLPEVSVANCHLGKAPRKLVGSGKDVSSISSLAGSNKKLDARATDCVPAGKNTYFRDDYVGLPLNSRGEFVKPHPAGIPSSIDILKRQCLGESSSYPSVFPTFFSPRTCTDRANLRPKHHVPQIEKVDQSPHFIPRAPIAYQTDFRQLSCSEIMKSNTVLSKKCPCTNQQELSSACFCPEYTVHHNPQQNLLGMQSYSMHRDGEQNTRPTAETTMRLMGKTVTLGSGGIRCRYPGNETPDCSKQTPAEDHSVLGTRGKAFPQSFHGDLVYPPYAFKISHGERELSENPSVLSLVSASEMRSELESNSFRTNGHNQQPELAAANRLYAQPAAWCNESELQHQQPVRLNQVQSSGEDMMWGSMHRRDTQSVASVPSFNRRNNVRNFVEKRQVPYQPSYFTQHFSNMTQRNPVSSTLSGYAAVQSTPGLTTQTKFTSLPPLPPSLTPSPVYGPDYAQPRGSTTNHPSIPAAYPTSKSNAPGNAISRDERVKWNMMGSNVEGLGPMNGNGKRPADKDGVLLASPKKPCVAAPKELNMLPIPETGLQFFGSRPDAQPVGFGREPQPDPRFGSQGAHTTWSYPVNTVRPVKLKPGARHIVEPSASSMSQDISWTVHSVTPFAAENGGSTTMNEHVEEPRR